MNVSSSDSGAYRLFEETEKPVLQYSYECDVRLKAGNNKSTQLALMSDGYTFSSNNVNYGIGSGYIFKLYSVNSTEWTINPDTDNKTVTIPNTEWVHLKVSGDSESGTTWLKLTNGEDILYSGAYMKIFNWTDDMQPLSDASETIDIDSLNEKNSDYLLYGRSVYAFGDSIVFGHTKPEESFMQLIAEDYNMDLAMYAVNGATVCQYGQLRKRGLLRNPKKAII